MTILFVCTGNTCRSPMAAALCRRMPCVVAESAGIAAADAPAAAPAIAVMREIGIDLGGHRAAQLTSDMLRRADLVAVMTDAHAIAVRHMGASPEKIIVLDAAVGGIPDPYGGSEEMYRGTRDRLAQAVAQLMQALPGDLARKNNTINAIENEVSS